METLRQDIYIPSKYAKFICREVPLPQGSQPIIIKSAYVVNKNNGDYNIIIQTGMCIADGERGNLLSQKMNGFWKIHEQ